MDKSYWKGKAGIKLRVYKGGSVCPAKNVLIGDILATRTLTKRSKQARGGGNDNGLHLFYSGLERFGRLWSFSGAHPRQRLLCLGDLDPITGWCPASAWAQRSHCTYAVLNYETNQGHLNQPKKKKWAERCWHAFNYRSTSPYPRLSRP